MERGNVLVIGNSGVGKSTLINAVLGEEKAVTGWGNAGTTKELAVYESERIPFRVIDSVGFEPSFLREHAAVRAVKKWSKESAKEENEDRRIHAIWFCVDGTSRKLFPKAIRDLSKATNMWETVPVIVVITKSYSEPERAENIQMVQNAFARQKRYAKNLRGIIPVVAAPYFLNDTAYAAPEGIAELIDATNKLLPEGIRASGNDVASFVLNRKRAFAHSLVGAVAAAGVTVGAVPIPFPDGLILAPIETAEVNAIARIYGIGKEENSKQFLNSIVEVGTVGLAAKTAIKAVEAIPGLSLGAAALNAVIAGSMITALGEGSIYAFEQVYRGEKTTADIDWVQKVIESKFSDQFIEKVKKAAENLPEIADAQAAAKVIFEIVSGIKKSGKRKK